MLSKRYSRDSTIISENAPTPTRLGWKKFVVCESLETAKAVCKSVLREENEGLWNVSRCLLNSSVQSSHCSEMPSQRVVPFRIRHLHTPEALCRHLHFLDH